jgi:hypothetical protein
LELRKKEMLRLAASAIVVALEDEACVMVCRPYRGGSLRPDVLEKIEATPVDASRGLPVRHVPFSSDQALAVYGYLRHRADASTAVADAKAPLYLRARDGVRRALQIAGIVLPL